MIGQQLIAKDKPYLAKRGSGVIANVNEINQLDAGAVALISGQTLIKTVADLTDLKYIQVAVGSNTQELGAVVSKRIERKSSINYSFKEYIVSRAEKLFIGDNGDDIFDIIMPVSLEVGKEASVTITDTSNNTIPESVIKTATYSVKQGDTKAKVIAGLVANINKLGMGTAVAIDPATSNAGISFTGGKVGVRYKISLGGIIVGTQILSKFNEIGAAISTANAPDSPYVGVGSYAQVKEQAEYLSTVFGDTSRNMLRQELFGTQDPINGPELNTNYDTFTLNYSLSGSYSTNTHESVPQYFQLVVPTDVAVVAVLKTLFAGVVTDANPIESGIDEENENVES